jgi:putative peptidoglycan lipid II flippase
MSLAVFFAGLVQMLILIFYCRTYYIPKINLIIKFTDQIKQFFTKLLPSIFSSGVMQINILVGTIIASFESSAVSYLYYADRIYQLPLAISGIAIGTVVLPVLSKSIISDSKEKVFFIQNRSVELSVFLSAPAAVGIIVGAKEIISCLFGYGSFNENSVINTANALIIFGFGLPAFSLLKLYSNFYFARGDTKFPFKVSVFTVLINIIISIAFFEKYGFLSIAAGTTVSCWLATFIYKYNLKIDNFHTSDRIFLERFAKIFVCSLIMGSILYYQFFYFQHYFVDSDLIKVMYLFFIVGNSIIVYFIMAVLFKAFSIKDFKLKKYK